MDYMDPDVHCKAVKLNHSRTHYQCHVSVEQWHKMQKHAYRQDSNIRRTLVGNYIVDHSDVVRASPVGAAPTTSSFSI